MAQLIVLDEDGPLGPAGTQVWVNDPEPEPEKPPAKKAPPRSAATHRKPTS